MNILRLFPSRALLLLALSALLALAACSSGGDSDVAGPDAAPAGGEREMGPLGAHGTSDD
jgi:hypothetical protein